MNYTIWSYISINVKKNPAILSKAFCSMYKAICVTTSAKMIHSLRRQKK